MEAILVDRIDSSQVRQASTQEKYTGHHSKHRAVCPTAATSIWSSPVISVCQTVKNTTYTQDLRYELTSTLLFRMFLASASLSMSSPISAKASRAASLDWNI